MISLSVAVCGVPKYITSLVGLIGGLAWVSFTTVGVLINGYYLPVLLRLPVRVLTLKRSLSDTLPMGSPLGDLISSFLPNGLIRTDPGLSELIDCSSNSVYPTLPITAATLVIVSE